MNREIKIDLHAQAQGLFKIEAVKLDGSKRVLADWFPNLITDIGLERMAENSGYFAWCQVGSGTTTPAVTDTALAERIAGSNTVATSSSGTQSTAPYYAWGRRTIEFAEGVAAGNLSEVGMGWATSGSLFSRALILDGNGDPTTITVLSDEILQVTYEFRFYPKTTDDTGQVTLTGNIGGTYDWIMRAANVTSTFDATGWGVGTAGLSQFPTSNASGTIAYDGNIGDITTSPSGSSSNASSKSPTAYSAGSLTWQFSATWDLDRGNFATGIRSVRPAYTGIGTYQVQFDPAIPKTNSDTLTLTFSYSWGRRP